MTNKKEKYFEIFDKKTKDVMGELIVFGNEWVMIPSNPTMDFAKEYSLRKKHKYAKRKS